LAERIFGLFLLGGGDSAPCRPSLNNEGEVKYMAVEKIPSGSALRMQFQTGLDGDGDPVYRTKSFSTSKPQL